MKPATLVLCAILLAAAALATRRPTEDGYRGIWYYNQPSKDQYVYKYSGGFATYPQQHAPIAIYARQVNKTFFTYGGTVKGKRELLHMVSYFDHATGTVPKPTMLLNKRTEDAHDNPTISIDDNGHIWIFSSAHGTSRPSFISRSAKPWDISEFEQVVETNFSYTQPWHIPGAGFLFLHTRYRPVAKTSGRALYWMTSPDGRDWSDPHLVAFALMGHYQISWPHGRKVGTAFDVHPPPLGLNQRTNLYYVETEDMGKTWRTADGKPVAAPVESEDHPSLVRDYRKQDRLVYLKDLQYDRSGRPVILYLTSKGYESGPQTFERMLNTARWTGKEWVILPVATTDHNYDHGSMYIEDDGTWRMIAPTGPGPQPWATGGEMEMWTSRDQGKSWRMIRKLTTNSAMNHTYARRPLHAHPDFYALWADGDAFKPSESRIYFANKNGEVFQLPTVMTADVEKPIRVD